MYVATAGTFSVDHHLLTKSADVNLSPGDEAKWRDQSAI
jgi:hypothetical protein